MTLGEGKRKVFELLDEYTSGGQISVDIDLDAKLADFFDTAQKELAQTAPIVKTAAVERTEGVTEYALPEDCMQLTGVWRDGRRYRGYITRGDRLYIPETDRGAYEIEYYRIPATINENTNESAAFEISENAAQCMPFFVAGMVLSSDMVQDPNIYLNMYYAMTAKLKTDRASGGRFRQTLWGRIR